MRIGFICILILFILNDSIAGGGVNGDDVIMTPASHPGSCLAIEFTNNSSSSQDYSFTPTAYNAATGLPITTVTLADSLDNVVVYWPTAGDKEICLNGVCQDYHNCNCNPVASDNMESAPLICNTALYCGTTSGIYGVDNANIVDPVHSGSLENNSFIKFIAASTNISFNINVAGGCSMQFAVYEQGTNSAGNPSFTILTDLVWTSVDGFTGNNTITASGLDIGGSYFIHFDGDGGAICDYELSFNSGAQLFSASTTSNTACAGNSATLSVTPADPATTYTWTDNFGNTYPNSSSIVVSPNVNTVYYVQIDGCQNQTDTIPITTCSVLPIELISFNAKCIGGNSVLLNWQTATETNNDYFIIEKSNDGLNFNSVGIVQGSGNSSVVNNYSLQDFELSNYLNYYRMKQVDYNGESSYADVIALRGCSSKKYEIISTFFNSEKNQIVINFNSDIDIESTLKIYNLQGKLIYEAPVQFLHELNQVNVNLNTRLNVGVYIINIITPNSLDNFKLMISSN